MELKISGFPEYLPHQQKKFQDILQKIQKIFEQFCAIPIETPAVERLTTLLKKGGNPKEIYTLGRLTENQKSKLGLRFDLTVPLARYVSQHFSEITFPFRRYQIQPVWRGERAQKGRYRQFYQCDFDIIGNESLSYFYDAETLILITKIFDKLGIKNYKIFFNHKTILVAILLYFKIKVENLELVLRILDKKEKITKTQFQKELETYIPSSYIPDFQKLFSLANSSEENFQKLTDIVKILQKKKNDKNIKLEFEKLIAINEIVKSSISDNKKFCLDLSIVRGLEYYTGTIFEIILEDYPELGSVCSGGRYENLASQFGKKKLPGVGFSIGISRLFNILYNPQEFQVLEKKLLIAFLGDGFTATNKEIEKKKIEYPRNYLTKIFEIAQKLRDNGIPTEVFLEQKKILTQIQYAEKKNYRWIAFYGVEEIAKKAISIKDLQTKEQKTIPLQKIIDFFKP